MLDLDAFFHLYDGSSRDVLRYFVQRTFDPQVAADLTAETFAEAYISRPGYDPTLGAPTAWLFGIARHRLAAYARTRRAGYEARRKLAIPERDLSSEDFERIEALVDLRELGARARAALQELPSDQRQAVTLRILDDMSYADIAAHVGVSEQAVRARVSRGLRALAAALTSPMAREQEG